MGSSNEMEQVDHNAEVGKKVDLIDRQAAIDAVDSETVSTNPEHFKSSEKFIKFMDDADIASFGKWQWANGFNTALTATTIQLKNLPSAQPDSKDIVEKIKNGITASNSNNEYFIGFRNGMRWCLSLIDDKEPIYESSAQSCYKTDHGYMWLCPECGMEVHSDYTGCERCGYERKAD